MTDEQRDKKLALLKNQAEFLLSNGFDSIQIFASQHDEGNTSYWAQGAGNYCARFGQTRLWVMQEEANEVGKE